MKEKVLLVDDNPTNLQVLVGMLGGRDYNLLIAKNGVSALTIVRKARPDLTPLFENQLKMIRSM
jgi:CheY-like chemotaxis protein